MKYLGCILAVSIFVAGCVQTPVAVSRPWNRSLSDTEIEKGSKISIVVNCESTPLIGNESLVKDRINETAIDLLTRRGFVVSRDNFKYLMKINYSTRQSDQDDVHIYLKNTSANLMINQSTVGIFSLLFSQLSSQTTTMVSSQRKYFVHTFSIDVVDQLGRCVWTADSIINHESIDVIDTHNAALQLAFGNLPNTGAYIPRVQKVKKDRAEDYRAWYMNNRIYLCPALPSKILFPGDYDSNDGRLMKINNTEALLAYSDLLLNAEIALPSGSPKEWINPLNKDIWASATLAGKYYLGNETSPTYIIVELVGRPNYYVVRTCKVVDHNVYDRVITSHGIWITMIREFFDFYVSD